MHCFCTAHFASCRGCCQASDHQARQPKAAAEKQLHLMQVSALFLYHGGAVLGVLLLG